MKTYTPTQTKSIRLAAPPCTLGITDGSERGRYVGSSHMLAQIGRPHHVVNLMFQYYPDMENWPTQGVNWHGFYRNNALNKGDGYFPLVLEPGGPWGQLYLRQIEDVRSHGQEPLLTLTLHADTPDEDLKRIALSLAPYGRMRIRINHECNGTWFYFNQRWSYKEVSDLFIRFHNIIHEHAPNVRTVACWNGKGESYKNPDEKRDGGTLDEDQLGPMFRTADIVSYDQYASLHWGWPDPSYDPARPSQYFDIPMDVWWKLLEEVHDDMCRLRGEDVEIEIHEANEDADVTGLDGQAAWVRSFYREVVERRLPWLKNITYYMFRDRGGLGLEKEDLEDPEHYEETPALAAYREAVSDPWFALRTEETSAQEDDRKLCWLSTTDAAGRSFHYDIPAQTKARLCFDPADHLLVAIGERWAVKRQGEAFIKTEADEAVRVFAPPPDGKNNQGDAFAAMLRHAPVWEVEL